MRARLTSAVALVALVLLTASCERGPPPSSAPPAEARVETIEAGPYRVDDSAFLLVTSVLAAGDEQSVVELRLVDGEGRVHWEEAFDRPAVVTRGLEFTVAVTAWRVEGASGSGLLLRREHLPSAPLTGESVQGFGVRAGTLRPLWPELAFHGELELPAADATGTLRLRDDDTIVLHAWRYHFGMIVPLALDWACEPGSTSCVRVAAPRTESTTGMPLFDVRTDLRPPDADTAITLYAAPGSDARERVSLNATSQIEVLEAAANVSLTSGEQLDVTVRDEFLHVRIDGRDGWIRGPEDFEAIGLAAAG